MVSIVSYHESLMDDMSVYENVALSYQLRNRIPDIQEIKADLKRLDIKDVEGFLYRKVLNLSGSEKQKVRIAKALGGKVKVFLVDELVSLDKEAEEGIFEVLKDIAKNILVIAVSRNDELMQKYSMGTIELSDGICEEIHFDKEDVFDAEEYVLKRKEHLSFAQSFKFALSFLASKKLMSCFIFVFTAVTCLLTGLSIVSLCANPTRAVIRKLYSENITDVILTQDTYLTVGLYPPSELTGGFTEGQQETIRSFTKQKELIYVYENAGLLSYSKNITYGTRDFKTAYDWNYMGNPNGFIEMGEADLDYTGFVLDSRIRNKEMCHFPLEFNEIALTSFKADMYLEYGYRDNENNIIPITTVDDLIGKKLDGFTITAVYETKEDKDFSKRHSFADGSNPMENEAYLKGTYINNYWIVKGGTVGYHYGGLINLMRMSVSITSFLKIQMKYIL